MKVKDFIDKCCFALEVELGTLNRDSSPENVESWDSLGYLNIIAMIDKELGVSFKADELLKFENLSIIIDELKKMGVLE